MYLEKLVYINMKIGRVKTESYHNYEEGDVAKPIDRDGSNKSYFKKGFWKRYDRKKFIRNLFNKKDLNQFRSFLLVSFLLIH